MLEGLPKAALLRSITQAALGVSKPACVRSWRDDITECTVALRLDGSLGEPTGVGITDREYFEQLEPVTGEVLSSLQAGQELRLFLMEYTPSGLGVVFPLRYVHRALSSDEARWNVICAVGDVYVVGWAKAEDVRIELYPESDSAHLHGRILDGEVRLGNPEVEHEQETHPQGLSA